MEEDAASPYLNNLTATSSWLAKLCQPDGSILYVPGAIEPYYANIAATGLTRDPTKILQVIAWMKWYVAHFNWPDIWGFYGTMYDYTIVNGVDKTATPPNCDSTVSYAATFLTLAWNLWQTGDETAQAYIKGLSYPLDVVGGVIILTQQSDGLTWAKPDYQIKYLMDNCEAYRGLCDLASLYRAAFGATAKAAFYDAAAAHMQQGILSMWEPGTGTWATNKNANGGFQDARLTSWYPDATAQLFPVLQGVIEPTDTRAIKSYAAFNQAWAEWMELSFNIQDPFPWCLVGCAAAAMRDRPRLVTYINSIQAKYVNKGFPWTFYNAEAGWFMRVNDFMLGHVL